MSDEKIDSQEFVLFNHWGDPVSYEEPKDGFTGSEHHNVATAAYRPGSVTQVYCADTSTSRGGYAQFVYLKLEHQDTTNVLAARMICTTHTDKEITDVTNDATTALADEGGFCAIALGAMTTDYYGWFWCGGVCPEVWVSALGGYYATDNTVVVATPAMALGDLADADTTYGEIGFIKQTAGLAKIGMCFSDDEAV
jgi:hypothetical protein